MRLAFSAMSERWTHTATIVTTLINLQKDPESDPALIRDSHPFMLPDGAEEESESGERLSLWELRGMQPPGG